jgi:hypothetical protein
MQWIVTSTAGAKTYFTKYMVHQQTPHHVDATPLSTASTYVLLKEIDWNIMIPTNVEKTQTQNVTATYHSHAKVIPDDDDDDAVTFSDYIKTLPEHIQQLLMHIKFVPGGKRMLKHCLENDRILKIGTDGSLNQCKETASFGWLLIGNNNVLVYGAGPVDGVPVVLSSTRAELFGIAAPNKFLFHFMKFHKIKSTNKCINVVDNQAAIARVNQIQCKHSCRCQYWDDVDIVMVIVDCMKASTLWHQL